MTMSSMRPVRSSQSAAAAPITENLASIGELAEVVRQRSRFAAKYRAQDQCVAAGQSVPVVVDHHAFEAVAARAIGWLCREFVEGCLDLGNRSTHDLAEDR